MSAKQNKTRRVCKTHGEYVSFGVVGGQWTECPQCTDLFEARTATCPEHGEYKSLNVVHALRRIGFSGSAVWTQCPACTSAENNRKADAERIEAAARENKRWRDRIGISEIPDRFLDRTLENYVVTNPGQQRAKDFARRYVDDLPQVMRTGRCAIFIGTPGTGKTHLAAAIASESIKKGHTALFVTVLRAIRRVKDTWRKGADETETDVVSAFVYPDLLVLDEIGVQFGTETEQNILSDIINERYEKRRPTIMLSNLSIGGVKEFIGERVFERLKEDGGEYVSFKWESYRSQQAGPKN